MIDSLNTLIFYCSGTVFPAMFYSILSSTACTVFSPWWWAALLSVTQQFITMIPGTEETEQQCASLQSFWALMHSRFTESGGAARGNTALLALACPFLSFPGAPPAALWPIQPQIQMDRWNLSTTAQILKLIQGGGWKVWLQVKRNVASSLFFY